jgi:CRP-like cAMP-binding protein
MLEHLDREVFKAGEYIFCQGDDGECAYLIERGVVEISNPVMEWRRPLPGSQS